MQKQLDKKKGIAGMGGGVLIGGVLAVVILGIVLGMGMLVLIEFNDATTDNTVSDALNDTVVGLAGLTDWIPIIIIMLVVAVIFGLLALGIFAISRVGGGASL